MFMRKKVNDQTRLYLMFDLAAGPFATEHAIMYAEKSAVRTYSTLM